MTESELILTDILDCPRADLYLKRPLILDKNQEGRLEDVLLRRKKSLPLQYILGKTEFMGLEFKVNSNVFIPRPETEVLVETVLKIVSSVPGLPVTSARAGKFQVSSFDILDIGTGSGNIVISLAKFLPLAKIVAIDISYNALKVAQDNARLNNVDNRIKFIKSDLFTNYELLTTNYELIVSNPPYIQRNELANLPLEVQYEPRLALDGGRDGLDFYRRIIKDAPFYLEEGGYLIMEMGFGQCPAIKNMFQESGDFEIIEVVKDYSGIERVIIAKINPKSEILNPKQTQNSKPKCFKHKRFGFGCFEFKEFEFV